MGLDIWFKEDIANALIAADEAASATAAALSEVTNDPERLRTYREGYRAALTTLALAFGISPLAVMTAPEEKRLRPEASSRDFVELSRDALSRADFAELRLRRAQSSRRDALSRAAQTFFVKSSGTGRQSGLKH